RINLHSIEVAKAIGGEWLIQKMADEEEGERQAKAERDAERVLADAAAKAASVASSDHGTPPPITGEPKA
ncbi:MAG: hypothetical protein PHD82_09275, partial [Candidatus Riflebacteria bacterium]|nr:hypothetical protein [Candidatus Riflebacteria bacterium]